MCSVSRPRPASHNPDPHALVLTLLDRHPQRRLRRAPVPLLHHPARAVEGELEGRLGRHLQRVHQVGQLRGQAAGHVGRDDVGLQLEGVDLGGWMVAAVVSCGRGMLVGGALHPLPLLPSLHTRTNHRMQHAATANTPSTPHTRQLPSQINHRMQRAQPSPSPPTATHPPTLNSLVSSS